MFKKITALVAIFIYSTAFVYSLPVEQYNNYSAENPYVPGKVSDLLEVQAFSLTNLGKLDDSELLAGLEEIHLNLKAQVEEGKVDSSTLAKFEAGLKEVQASKDKSGFMKKRLTDSINQTQTLLGGQLFFTGVGLMAVSLVVFFTAAKLLKNFQWFTCGSYGVLLFGFFIAVAGVCVFTGELITK